jgi:6-phosphogluconolactonase
MNNIIQTKNDNNFSKEITSLLYSDYIKSIKKYKRFNLALTGGRTPIIIYKYLRDHYLDLIDWSLVFFYFVDERYVPSTSKDSNYYSAEKYLFQFLHSKNVFRFRTEIDPILALNEYTNIISNCNINTALLGMGEDGHVGSVFPNSLDIDSKSLVVFTDRYYNKHKRFTLTLMAIRKIESKILVINRNNKKIKILMSDNKNYPINNIGDMTIIVNS